MRPGSIHRSKLGDRQTLPRWTMAYAFFGLLAFPMIPLQAQSELGDLDLGKQVGIERHVIRTEPRPRLQKWEPSALSRREPSPLSIPWEVIQLQPLPGQLESPVVTAISISSDQSMLAAAGDDHAIRLVLLKNGKTLHTLMGHTDWVQSLAFSNDGATLGSCGNDGTVRLWSTGQDPKMISVSQVPHALSVLVYGGSHRLFVAGFSGNIYRLDFSDLTLAPEKQPRRLPLAIHRVSDGSDVRSMDCSLDLQWLAMGGRDGILRVCSTNMDPDADTAQSVRSGRWEISAPVHLERIRSVHFSEDGSSITTVSEDRRIHEFDFRNRCSKSTIEIPGGKLMALCPWNDDLMAVSGSDNVIRIIDRNQASVATKLIGHDGSVTVLKRCGDYLISSGFDTTIRVWNVEQAIADRDESGRFSHPVAAQFENSGAGDLVR